MDKVVYVAAYFAPIGKEVTVKVPTGETKKGLFGGEKQVTVKEKQWQQTGWSDSQIDGARLAKDIAAAVDELNANGYRVSSITPITSGNYDFKYQYKEGSGGGGSSSYINGISGAFGYGYGYGYSYTTGVVIVANNQA